MLVISSNFIWQWRGSNSLFMICFKTGLLSLLFGCSCIYWLSINMEEFLVGCKHPEGDVFFETKCFSQEKEPISTPWSVGSMGYPHCPEAYCSNIESERIYIIIAFFIFVLIRIIFTKNKKRKIMYSSIFLLGLLYLFIWTYINLIIINFFADQITQKFVFGIVNILMIVFMGYDVVRSIFLYLKNRFYYKLFI